MRDYEGKRDRNNCDGSRDVVTEETPPVNFQRGDRDKRINREKALSVLPILFVIISILTLLRAIL